MPSCDWNADHIFAPTVDVDAWDGIQRHVAPIVKIGAEREPVVQSLVETPRPVLDASAGMWIHSSVVDQAHRVRQPIRVIAARRDLMYNPEFQRQTTLITLPQATMEVLDCAHFIPCEEPASLARLIEDFCQALPPT